MTSLERLGKIDEDKARRLVELLDTIKIPKVKNTKNRTKVLLHDATPEVLNEARSIQFGRGMVIYKGFRDYVANERHPEVYEALKDFAPAGFEFCGITLNKNVRSSRHIDTYNKGDAIFVSIGDFTGGKLVVECDDGIHKVGRGEYVKFDGKYCPHYTEPFEGTRYSLIYRN